MTTNRCPFRALVPLSLLIATAQIALPQELLWKVGNDDNSYWSGVAGGGPDAYFVQENRTVNPLPGDPYSPPTDTQADNDYYFAGTYYYVIESNGVYDPIGLVDYDEEAAERALVPEDYEMRYHFNLPGTLKPTDLLSVGFDMMSLDGGAADPRYGVSVYINNVLVQDQILIRSAQLDVDYRTPAKTLAEVGAVAGPDYDNIVTLRGTSYSAEGGGDWMGIDYVQLTKEASALPVPVFPWAVGSEDDAWPTGNGGGPNATFVEGNGSVNALPGSPTSTEVAGGADNDYYLAGQYSTVIAGNGTYTPVGLVPVNEEGAEGGFSGSDNELRYHFNLPVSMQADSLMAVEFDALNLDTSGADPRYGVEVYVNGVLVQSELLIRAAQLDQPITTPPFTMGDVNAQVGLGPDNIVTLRGISYSAQGGGNALGIDYVRLKPMPKPPVVPWSVGRNDNAWPADNGGGPNTTFVAENGAINPLPGVPNSPEVDGQADNDYYLAGLYSAVIPANGTYTPVGDVPYNEEAAERAFAGADNDLRYHFNLPATLTPDAQFTFSFDPSSLDDSGGTPHYGVAVYVNNVQVQPEIAVGPDYPLNRTIFTPPFTLAQVNAQVGPGYDNIVSLRGINYSAEGGGNWMGLDYVRLDPVLPPPWPLDVNQDNNGHAGSAGGGINALFVQEAGGVNALPGNPAGGEVDQQSDNDYYFAGTYTTVIPGVVQLYGEYEPVGTVLVNEYAAERAFAGADNDLRYHFNLPSSLQPSDSLFVGFDAVDLDGSGSDPRWGAAIYFNGVEVLPEVVIGTADLDTDYVAGPFTLASVDARVGPGYDNVVTLKGISYNAEGGGNWMGIDYLQVSPMPQPVFPWAVGMDDDDWPVGDGGGPNATFVQEANLNDLPGNPKNREMNQQADDDYYFAGVYTSVIPANGFYEPVGYVLRNEEAAERAFAGADNDLRYHFNLPTTLQPTDEVEITFDALNLQTDGTAPDPRYGIEVYFNSTLVQPEIIVRTNDLDFDYTTPPFTLASVNAGLGAGYDNIVTLRGINYSTEGGGGWMGIDYVQLHPAGAGVPPEFTSSAVAGGKVTLAWEGTGNLEWAPAVTGPWTPISPSPTSPYSEDLVAGQTTRFYRLTRP